MRTFENFVYPILNSVHMTCLPMDNCPAIKAEKENKNHQQVIHICEECWDRLKEEAQGPKPKSK
ncbi:MAG: hypothetical protein J6Y07_02820 [Alphaproteobacteria bacterium]|nr:hypothetical protein [Alphaproteobacteria bacterium]